jgi:hypothetical protein
MKKTQSLAYSKTKVNMSSSLDSQRGNLLELLESSQDYAPKQTSHFPILKSEVGRNTALFQMNSKRILNEAVLKHYVFNPKIRLAEDVNATASQSSYKHANFYMYGHLLQDKTDTLVHSMLKVDFSKLKQTLIKREDAIVLTQEDQVCKFI